MPDRSTGFIRVSAWLAVVVGLLLGAANLSLLRQGYLFELASCGDLQAQAWFGMEWIVNPPASGIAVLLALGALWLRPLAGRAAFLFLAPAWAVIGLVTWTTGDSLRGCAIPPVG